MSWCALCSSARRSLAALRTSPHQQKKHGHTSSNQLMMCTVAGRGGRGGEEDGGWGGHGTCVAAQNQKRANLVMRQGRGVGAAGAGMSPHRCSTTAMSAAGAFTYAEYPAPDLVRWVPRFACSLHFECFPCSSGEAMATAMRGGQHSCITFFNCVRYIYCKKKQ